MNEEALKDVYGLFSQSGYNGSQDEFYTLLSENAEAFADSYGLFKKSGYNGSEDEYKNLLGLKKKDATQDVSSILEKTQQEATTSNLEEPESFLDSEEYSYPDFSQPQVTQEDLKEQLDAGVSEDLAEDNNFVQDMYAKITSTEDIEDMYSTEGKFLYEQDWMSNVPETSQGTQDLSAAQVNFYSQKDSDFGVKKKEFEDRLRYLSNVKESPEEYLKRVLGEDYKYSEQEIEAAKELHDEQFVKLNKEYLDFINKEEYKSLQADWSDYIFNTVKEQHPEEDESFIMKRSMQLGMNPYNVRRDGLSINGSRASYSEVEDYLYLNYDELVSNPESIEISDELIGDEFKNLRGLKEQQLNSGGAFGDFFENILTRSIGFGAGFAEATMSLDPVLAYEYSADIMPIAKELKELGESYAKNNIRKYKYGISESIANGEYQDATNQVANMTGSAIFDIVLMMFTKGYGLGASSLSAGGDYSMSVKEFNENVSPENQVGIAGRYAGMAATTAIIAGTELFTLRNVKAGQTIAKKALDKLTKSKIIKSPRAIPSSKTIGDSFIEGFTKDPYLKAGLSIAYGGAGEATTETIQQVGQEFTNYFTGLYGTEDEDGKITEPTFEEFVDEKILSYDMMDVAIGSLLPGMLPKAGGHAISHFANKYVDIKKEAQFSVEDVATGKVTVMSRNEYVRHTENDVNKKAKKDGKQKWRAVNANQLNLKIEKLLSEFTSTDNTEARNKMTEYDNQLSDLSKRLNVTSKNTDNDSEILQIVNEIADVEAKMQDLQSEFVSMSNNSKGYLNSKGDFRTFIKDRGYKIKNRLNTRVKNNDTANVTNTTTDGEITTDEQAQAIESQLKRNIKKPNVVTKQSNKEVSKDNKVQTKAEVEVNEFSSKKAAKRALIKYKNSRDINKLNKGITRKSNAKNFDAADTSKMDKMSQSDFDEMLNNGDYHIISADKSGLSDSENANRRNNLIARLNAEGIEFTETLASVDGKSEVQFLLKGKKDGTALTDGEALALAELMNQKTIISGKNGVLGTDGSSRKQGKVLQGDSALDGGTTTFINVDGKKVAIHHESGKKSYAKSYDADNATELEDYLKNKVAPSKAKYLLPVIKMLSAFNGLNLKIHENSESVIRDLIQKAYDKKNLTSGDLDVDSINIEVNPETDKVQVIFTPELQAVLQDLNILEEVLSDIDEVSSRGFYNNEDGSVSLNLDRIQKNTLFHELGHPIHEFLEKHDPAKFDEINKELKNKSRWTLGKDGMPRKQTYFEWASSNKTYQNQAVEYAKHPSNKSKVSRKGFPFLKTEKELINDFYFGEAFAEYLGDAAAQKIDASKTRRFLDFIIRNTKKKVRKDLENLNLDDFSKLDDLVDNLATALTTGETIVYNDEVLEVRESESYRLAKMDVSYKNYNQAVNGQSQPGSKIASGKAIVNESTKSDRGIKRLAAVDEDAISRPIDMTKVEVVDPEVIDGVEVFVSAIDKSIVADITSPTGVTHNMMGGILYSLQDGAGIWAFTTLDAANKFIGNLKKKGVNQVALMTQADTGILGNLNFNDYIVKELNNSINKGLVTEKEVLDSINTKLNLAGNKKVLAKLSKPITEKGMKAGDVYAPVSLPIQSIDDYKKMLLKLGTVNRNQFNKTFIEGNAALLDKAGIPRLEKMLEYVNDPLITEAQNGDIVGVIELDLNSEVVQTSEGDKGHHPAYPFVVYGEGLKVFNRFVDVRDAFPKFRTYDTKNKKFNTPLEEKKKSEAARSIGLTTATAVAETKKTKRLQVIGTEANLNEVMKKNYLLALDMEDKGSMPEYIRQVTMWEKGQDGLWRYEINDGDFKPVMKGVFDNILDELDFMLEDPDFKKKYESVYEVKNKKRKLISGGEEVSSLLESVPSDLTLKDLIDDPVLDLYPEIGNTSVFIIVQDSPSLASYNQRLKAIRLNVFDITKYGQPKLDSDYLFSSLKHEIQHAVQDIEGFPEGGTHAYFEGLGTKNLSNLLDRQGFSGDQLKEIIKPINKSRRSDLTFVNKIKKLIESDSILRLKKDYANPKNALLTEHPVLGDDKEYLGGFSGVSIYEDYIEPVLEGKNTLMTALSNLELESQYALLKSEFDSKYNPIKFYESIYGEVEARVVESRLGMDEKARILESITQTMNKEMDKLAPREFIMTFNTKEQFDAHKNQPEILRQKLQKARDLELLPTKRLQITEDADTFDNTIASLNVNLDEVSKWRKQNKKPRRTRVPSENIMKYANQEITFDEYTQTLRQDYPYMYDSEASIAKLKVPEFTSFDLMTKALKKAQVEKGLVGFNKKIPNGTRVGSRLDINANGDFGVLCNSIHTGDSRGKIIGYGKFSLLSNVTFRTNPSTALGIGLGEVNKSPFARMEGDWKNATEAEVQTIAEEMLQKYKDGGDVVRVSMRPDMASYFFDTKTGLPLSSAGRLVQVGGFILAENPELTTPSDSRFMAKNSEYPGIKRYQDAEEDYKRIESEEFRSNAFEAVLNATDVPRQPRDWAKLIEKFPGGLLELRYLEVEEILQEFKDSNNIKNIRKEQALNIIAANLTKPAIASIVKDTNKKYTYDDLDFDGETLKLNDNIIGTVDEYYLDAEGVIPPRYDYNEVIDDIITRNIDTSTDLTGLDILNDAYDHDFGKVKWNDLTLPGGENYKEIIIRDVNERILFPSNIHWQHLDSSEGGGNNVLVHVRTDDRIVDGKKILLIQEIQSDWAQRATDKTSSGERLGFKKDNPPLTEEEQKELNSLEVSGYAHYSPVLGTKIKDPWVRGFVERSRAYRNFELIKMVNERMSNVNPTEDLINLQRYLQLQKKENRSDDAVRDMPWGKTQHWLGLGFRKAINIAMNEGYDGIALVNGKMSRKLEGHSDDRLAEFYNSTAPKELVKQLRRLDGGIASSLVSGVDLDAETDMSKLNDRINKAYTMFNVELSTALEPYGASQSDLIDYESRMGDLFESDGFITRTILPLVTDNYSEDYLIDGEGYEMPLRSRERYFNYLSDLKNSYAEKTDKSNVAAALDRVELATAEYYYYNVVQTPEVENLGSALRVDFTDQSKKTHENSHGPTRFQADDDQEFLSFSSPALDILFGIKKAFLEADYSLGERLTRSHNEKFGFTRNITNEVTGSDPLRIRASRFLFQAENTFGDPALTDLFARMQGEVAVAMDKAKRTAVIFGKAFEASNKDFTPKQLTEYLRGYKEVVDENGDPVLNEDGTQQRIYLDVSDLDENVTISLFGKDTEVNLRDLIVEMREDIDKLSQKGLETGAFTGSMEVAVKENLGIYLHRSYKKFKAENYDLTQDQVDRSKKMIRESVLEGSELDPVKDKDQIEKVVDTIFADIFSNSTGNFAADGLTASQVGIAKEIFKGRQDIPMEIRDIMGEIHDPLITYIESISKLNKTISTHMMLDKMQKMGEGKFWSSEKVEGMIVSNGLSKKLGSKFGAFEGHYVSDEMYSVLNNVYQDTQHKGVAAAIYGATLITKWSKTVGNIPTHLRNLLGNFAFVLQSGHLPLNPQRMGAMVSAFNIVVNNFRYKPESSKQEIYDYLKTKGIMTSDTEVGLINDIYKDLESNNFDMSLTNVAKTNRIVSALKGGYRAMNKIYQSEDEIFKIYGFLIEQDRYKKAGLSEAQANDKAADIINNTYPNYAKIPNIVRKIGKFPFFGTFVAFQSESLRVSYNVANIAREELSSSNPTIRRIGAERMAGVIVNNTIADAAYRSLAVLGLGYFSGEDEDEESIYGTKVAEQDPNKLFRKIVPHYNKTGNLSILSKGFIPGYNVKSFDGQLNNDSYVDFFDSSKIDGTGFHKNMMRIMMSEIPEEGNQTEVTQLFEEFLGPFLGVDITVKSAADATELYNELIRKGYSYGETALEVSKLLFDDLSPSMIKNAVVAGKGLLGDEASMLMEGEMENEDIPTEQALLRLLGITVQRVNINKALFFGAKERYGKMQVGLDKLGINFRDLDDPKMIGIIGSDDLLSSRVQDLMDFVTACKHYGDLHEQDIDAILSSAGVSSYVKNYIRYNKEPFVNQN